MPNTQLYFNMDTRQIESIQHSFKKLTLRTRYKMTRVLYRRLFELDPSLKKLFKSDLKIQRKRFLKSLSFILENLYDAEIVGNEIKTLAIRHAGYGVIKEHYHTFGESIMFAMSAALGDDFTPDLKNTWKHFYTTISQIMLNSAADCPFLNKK